MPSSSQSPPPSINRHTSPPISTPTPKPLSKPTNSNRHSYPPTLSANHRATTRPRTRAVRDLNILIDEHLAWQAHAEYIRPASAGGTMIVDWDGTGEPAVSWREEEENGKKLEEYENGKKLEVENRKDSFMTDEVKKRMSEMEVKKATRAGQERRKAGGARKNDGSLNPPSPPQNLYVDETGLRATYHPRTSELGFSAATSSTSTSTAQQHPPDYAHNHNNRAPYIAGHDPSTAFSYNYDGETMHIHRSARPFHPPTNTHSLLHNPIPLGATIRSPAFSSTSLDSHSSFYTAIDTTTTSSYNPASTLHIIDPSSLTALPANKRARKTRRSQKVARFLGRVLGVVDSCGWLERMREDRRRGMKGVRRERRRVAREGGEESWVKAGYVT